MTPCLARLSLVTALTATVLASPGTVGAQQPARPWPHVRPGLDRVTIKVYNTTFNQLADQVTPIELHGHYTLSVTTCVPITLVQIQPTVLAPARREGWPPAGGGVSAIGPR